MTWIWVPVGPDEGPLLKWCERQGASLVVGGTPDGRSPPALTLFDLRELPADRWPVHLETARIRFPGTPLIVVCSFTREAVRALARTTPVEVLWDDEVDELERIVSRIVGASLRERLAALLTAGQNKDALAARAIRLMLSDAHPPKSVAELARRLFVSESTLRGKWRSAALPGSPRTLEDWSIVCALAEGRHAGRSVESLARYLQINGSTVYRVARRLLGCPPNNVTAQTVLDAAAKVMGER